MSTRREARERVMQAVYAFTVGVDNADHVIETIIDGQMEDKEGIAFATKLFLRTLDTTDETNALLEKYTRNWDVSRIALVDRIVLKIAMVELMYFPDIPPKVTINEAIEVAKRYSTEKSGKFVNGILDAILADLKAEGKLKKTGRGLIGLEG